MVADFFLSSGYSQGCCVANTYLKPTEEGVRDREDDEFISSCLVEVDKWVLNKQHRMRYGGGDKEEDL